MTVLLTRHFTLDVPSQCLNMGTRLGHDSGGSTVGTIPRMRYLVAIILVPTALVLLWEFVPIVVSVWIGHFILSVTIEGAAADSIRSAQCVPCTTKAEAEYIVAHWPYRELTTAGTTIDPFDGGQIEVVVTVTGRSSPMGRELARFQPQYVAVLVTLETGDRLEKIVDIPDGRTSRSVNVEFP